MSRLRSGSKALSASTAVILLLLICLPLQATQKREAPAAHPVSALSWVSNLWSSVATWLAGKVAALPSGTGAAVLDGSCAVDPFGCPHGG